MTIEENVYFPLRMKNIGRAAAKERIDRALDMVRMRGFSNRKPAQLSGGQQQRIALARALVFEPELVLMDEPLGALDKQLREHMQLEIKQLHKELGVTVVYVTHDQSEALTMSDRIAIFNDGIVQQLDSPEHIYDRPATPFVAQFIGDNNIIEAEIVAAENSFYVAQVENCPDPTLALKVWSQQYLSVGQKVLLAVRPEKISVSSEKIGDNHVAALIEQMIYYGDHVRLQVMFAGKIITIKTAIEKISGLDMRPGFPIHIGWNIQDCCIFAKESGATEIS